MRAAPTAAVFATLAATSCAGPSLRMQRTGSQVARAPVHIELSRRELCMSPSNDPQSVDGRLTLWITVELPPAATASGPWSVSSVDTGEVRATIASDLTGSAEPLSSHSVTRRLVFERDPRTLLRPGAYLVAVPVHTPSDDSVIEARFEVLSCVYL